MTSFSTTSKYLILILVSVFNLNTHANIIVMNGLSHHQVVDRGGVQKGVIQVRNNGTEPQAVAVYQQDISFNHNGETFYKNVGYNERSNTQWMIINPQSLLLQPMETADIVFEVRVPDSAGLIGSYWSTIIIEPVKEIDTAAPQSGLSVSTILRYAIQVVTDINDSASTSLEFLNVTFERLEEQNMFLIDVENTGQLMLRSEMAVELFNEAGESLGVFRSSRKRTYPGTSKRYMIELPPLNPGKYEAILIAESGKDDVFGIQVSLVVEDD